MYGNWLEEAGLVRWVHDLDNMVLHKTLCLSTDYLLWHSHIPNYIGIPTVPCRRSHRPTQICLIQRLRKNMWVVPQVLGHFTYLLALKIHIESL